MKFYLNCMLLCLIAFLIKRVSCNTTDLKFPTSFKFGVGSSAYQIEGAWNESGKGESIWDYFSHNDTFALFINNETGDVASDSYHKYREDVQLLKSLGVNYYRFSISWSRILPDGGVGKKLKINKAGVEYYQNLLDELEAAGIEPLVSLVVLDTPLSIFSVGGTSNPKFVKYFLRYADLAFKLFGNRVKNWVTFSEPVTYCVVLLDALGQNLGSVEYLCGYNMLRAHAKAYRLYEKKYKRLQKGKVSMVLDLPWMEPATNSTLDIEAAERKRQWQFGWYAHPLVYGNYPEIMIETIQRKSLEQGLNASRLPQFTEKEIKELKGAYDFIALNHYSTELVKSNFTFSSTPSYKNDIDAYSYTPTTWSGSSYTRIVPSGFRKVLNWVKDTYNNPEILITENGYGDASDGNGGSLNDTSRINYVQSYLNELLLAINEDNVNVTAYTLWAFIDDFEWNSGYKAKYGLYQVDFDSPNRTRTERQSAAYYRQVIKTRCLINSCID